jgi:catechol 2,3-dioxygenase
MGNINLTTLRIGQVGLYVPELERMSDFYRSVLGLSIIEENSDYLVLGAGSNALVRLILKPGSRHYPNAPGLYHFAILLPERFSLARLLYHMVEKNHAIQGASDHGVSEALYLGDPFGNGIELYRDRPENEWPREPDGSLGMTTQALNLDRLLFELKGRLEPWRGIDPKTVVGHVHLQVSDVQKAIDFYQNVVGLELQQTYGSQAAFLSAGGYHHHVGVNTWHSRGESPSPADAAGIAFYELIIPEEQTILAILKNAKETGITTEELDLGFLIRDPSGNGILLRVG